MVPLIAQYGIFLVALIIFAGELGFPTLVPGEIALLMGGAHFIHSMPALCGAALGFALVDIVATSTLHGMTRTAGNRLLVHLLKYVCPGDGRQEAMVVRWRQRLGGHDSLVVLVTRLIPMVRLYASAATGLIRIRFRDFLLGVVPASVIWASTPLTIGYLLRRQITSVEQHYGFVSYVGVFVSVSLVVVLVTTGWIRRANSSAARICRLRLVVGLATISGVAARLLVLVLDVHPIGSSNAFTLEVWVATAGAIALGLLWAATHDFRGIHIREHRMPGPGKLHGVVWMALMLLFAGVTAWSGAQDPAVLLT